MKSIAVIHALRAASRSACTEVPLCRSVDDRHTVSSDAGTTSINVSR